MNRAALILAAALALSGCQSWTLKSDLSYDTTKVPSGVFDFYEPRGDEGKARPAIFYIHGGAWEMGDKSEAQKFADELCPDGYCIFSVNYRLTQGAPGSTAPWPAQIIDVEEALRYVRANAALFRVDPDKIASMGTSAGGHLATMVCLRTDPLGPTGRTRFVVDLDGEMDMTKPGNTVMTDFDQILTAAMGHAPPWTQAELADISPVYFARQDAAALIIHGTQDPNVFFPNAGWLKDALTAKNAEVKLVPVQGACHGNCWEDPTARAAIHDFLNKHLK